MTPGSPLPRLALVLLLLLGASFWPGAAPAETAADSDLCRLHARRTEQLLGIPPGLLQAMSEVESRRDRTGSWPWTVNLAGAAYYAGSYIEAAVLLRDRNGHPRRDVAVGCLQIDMRYHGHNFPVPEWALHPELNALYGGRLLLDFRARSRSWHEAVGRYNAQSPDKRHHYACRVAFAYARIAGLPPNPQLHHDCGR